MEKKVVIPYSQESEHAVLGSILKDKDAFLKVQGMLCSNDFYDPANSIIFESIERLFSKGLPMDIVTIPDDLRDYGVLDKIGGIEYLFTLEENAHVTSNIVYYAKIIKDKALQRKIIQKAQDILNLDYNSQIPAEDLLATAESMIIDIGDDIKPINFVHVKEIVPEVYEAIEKNQNAEHSEIGIMSGYRDLDEITNGFQKSDLIILAARPSAGKTAISLNFALNAANNHKNVIFFSLEMSKEQVVERMLSADAEVSISKFKRFHGIKDEEKIRLNNAMNHVFNLPIYIDDYPGTTIADIQSKVRRIDLQINNENSAEIKNKNKKINDLIIFIDYLQLMRSTERSENRVQEISKMTRQLKNIAREMKCPVVLLSQLSREIEKRQDKKPILSDLRESGSIEQDADLVMFLYKKVKNTEEDEINMEPDVDLLICKHRNGPIGKVELTFDKKFMKFRERNYYRAR